MKLCYRKITFLIAMLVMVSCNQNTPPDRNNINNDATNNVTPRNEVTSNENEESGVNDNNIENLVKPTGPFSEAVAPIFNRDGEKVGEVTFRENNIENRVYIEGKFFDLKPNATLGFHIHENSICKGDFKSSGGHFNPTNKLHGKPGIDSHAGDLGNLHTDSNGEATYRYASSQINLGKDKRSVIGLSVIIHSGEDNFVSQPAGDAGERIACGIIRGISS